MYIDVGFLAGCYRYSHKGCISLRFMKRHSGKLMNTALNHESQIEYRVQIAGSSAAHFVSLCIYSLYLYIVCQPFATAFHFARPGGMSTAVHCCIKLETMNNAW